MAVQLSIIIPVFNQEPYLCKCLDSVLRQDVDAMEIICVDDGSTDASGTILDQYAARDNRIHAIHQTNHGAMHARKSGISKATGKYVTFVDGDDYLDDGLYRALIQEAEDQSADIVVYAFQHEDGESSVNRPNLIASGLYENDGLLSFYAEMMNRDPFYTFTIWPNQVNKLFLREIVTDVQMDAPDDITVGDDAAVSFPALLRAKRIYVDNDLNGYHYRMVTGSITHRSDKKYYHRVSVLYDYLKEVFSSQRPEVKQLLMPQLERYRMYLAEPVLSLREEILSVSPGLSAQELRAKTLEWTDGATIFDGLTESDIPGVSKGAKKRMALAARGKWQTYDRNVSLARLKVRMLRK